MFMQDTSLNDLAGRHGGHRFRLSLSRLDPQFVCKYRGGRYDRDVLLDSGIGGAHKDAIQITSARKNTLADLSWRASAGELCEMARRNFCFRRPERPE